ncbi:PLP-dependent aminotransferase family protein [Rhodococcus sp. CX]|uniref:aminotransferase-like domain-containing protein n=1 Tax=Rhodococcus sp. CX TaxID=2789880 RepID=UPI0018CED688|nr:PLP-dependent aminotransferase family protein [Rhodococcus sp. CX]MBH0121656.1 PLP-dependent aminotransferase family protein [Rhodococcus sp. CX]
MTRIRARRLDGLTSSAIRDLLEVTARPEVISLAGGLPAAELLPTARLAEAAASALADPATAQYTETCGLGDLRTVIAARESGRLGRTVDPQQVVVTHGSQQALSLIAQALLDPGDLVVVEEPAYTGALQVFRAAEATLASVPVDDDGLDTDALEELLVRGARPVLVHTVATFHNPRGAVLSAPRRAHLAALADRYGFRIVEDDPYGDLWFGTPPPAPVASHTDRVIRLSSASKIIAPALRVGWLLADRDVCASVELLKQGADLCGSSLTQRIAADLLADTAWLDAHLTTLRATYGARAHALAAALTAEFGPDVTYSPVRGGMFTWSSLPTVVPAAELLPVAADLGVAFVPGDAFAVAGDHTHSVRLCFATSAEDELAEAVRRLGAAVRTAEGARPPARAQAQS